MTASSERPSSLAGLCPVASGTVARLQAPSIAPGPGVVNVAVVTACQRHHCDGLSTPALWDRVATMARVLESLVSLGRQLAGGMGAAVVTVALVHTGVLEPLETWALDRLFEFRGARQPSAPIVIVTIDEASNTELHTQWPFPRAMHGALLDRISAGGPLAIGVDLIFDRPSSRGLKDDRALSAAVARAGNVVLAAAPTVDPQTLQQQGISLKRIDENPPLPTIRQGAADVGSVNVFYDADGLIRRVPLRVGVGERTLPRWVATLVAVVTALLGSALVGRLRALRALGAAVLVWGILTLGAIAGFALGDVWMRGMAGTIALVLGYGSTVVEHFVREQREKRRLSRFFSPPVLRTVVRASDKLSSRRRLVTVLFSDLRGFTSISEKLQPEQVAAMLREYLTEMTEIVFDHDGTVDKYIGDCVMALYNVPSEDPEHAIKAVRTGLAFQERTLAAAARWEAKFGVTIRCGVGINTGEAIVGILGSRQRFEYTAIGDTVNLAARLESLTKDYGASIIVSESTYEHVKGVVATRELGAVTVRGKSVPVKIYAVLATDVRKYPRAVLDAAAALTDAATGLVCRVGTVDISEGGLALADVPADWTVGSTVRLRLEKGALAIPIVAEGTIVWRRGAHAGVSFTAIEPESVPVVAEYVAGRKGPCPSTTR